MCRCPTRWRSSAGPAGSAAGDGAGRGHRHAGRGRAGLRQRGRFRAGGRGRRRGHRRAGGHDAAGPLGHRRLPGHRRGRPGPVGRGGRADGTRCRPGARRGPRHRGHPAGLQAAGPGRGPDGDRREPGHPGGRGLPGHVRAGGRARGRLAGRHARGRRAAGRGDPRPARARPRRRPRPRGRGRDRTGRGRPHRGARLLHRRHAVLRGPGDPQPGARPGVLKHPAAARAWPIRAGTCPRRPGRTSAWTSARRSTPRDGRIR